MRETINSPVSPLLVAFVMLVIGMTVFAWSWAVRRPVAPQAVDGIAAGAPSTPSMEKPRVYAAVGASDVVGVGADNPAGESWVNVVHGMMPAGTQFIRLGRGGITLREANLVEIPRAVEAQPDIVTLWNCVNDAIGGVPVASYTSDLKQALDTLTRKTQARIVVLNIPDISSLMAGHLDPQQRQMVRGGILQWNAAIANTSAQYGDRVKLVDLFPISGEIAEHPEYISPDNFHPSTTGYRRLAEVVWQTIEREKLLAR
ncbi:MAG TPA: GDSL-type esterase/lipase family protein [Chloroflexia bacterium]|nr:GDSL-type esterase/lipase family protein [Chloroflexia bacterium]